MSAVQIEVRMLGPMTLRCEGQEVRDTDNRARKIWLLLAYMAARRGQAIPQEELVALLWEREERSSNPANALKTMFHRLRSMMCQLDALRDRNLIIRKNGTYSWNPDLCFTLDTETFESLCRDALACQEPGQQLELLRRALALYRGDFLPKLSSESWVNAVNTYYHGLYLQSVSRLVALLEARGLWQEIEGICRTAVALDPYNEVLCQHLLRSLLQQEKQQDAADTYQRMSELLFDTFGVMPSEESKSLYREALSHSNEMATSIDLIRDQLREPIAATGAMVCQYDFFKIIYQAEARSVSRNGYASHLCLFSITGADDQPLAKRSLEVCMENFQDLACASLRKGDVMSRCSVSQYIVLLSRANYENSRKVCDRVVRAFRKKYPHSPAVLRCAVQPLEPMA